MALNFNGTEVENIIYNGVSIEELYYNGTLIWSSSNEITFNIGSITYTAEEGMTWREFINSSYNDGTISEYYSEYIWCQTDEWGFVVTSTDYYGYVTPTDVIIAGEMYQTNSEPI